MDYERHYSALIERAKLRERPRKVERHHITPRCMGGNDAAENLADLTPEEHFVAHQLLMRMHPGNRSLAFAAWAMTRGVGRSNKRYGWIKRAISDAMTGRAMSDDVRRKISLAAAGRTLDPDRAAALHEARRKAGTSDAHRKKLSDAQRGKPKSESHRLAIAAASSHRVFTQESRARLAANKGRQLSDKQRAALLAAVAGKPLSDEHKAKLSAAKKGARQPVVSCPHCGKQGGQSLMLRWHFDNCGVQHGKK